MVFGLQYSAYVERTSQNDWYVSPLQTEYREPIIIN